MTVVELIVKEMKKQKVSAYQLSKNIDMDRGNLSKLLNGKRGGIRPGFGVIMRITRELKIDAKRLNEVEV